MGSRLLRQQRELAFALGRRLHGVEPPHPGALGTINLTGEADTAIGRRCGVAVCQS